MPVTANELLAAAHAAVPKISAQDAAALAKSGNVLFVDVRDGTEVAVSGKVPGAVHVARGSLEMRACPDYPSHLAEFDRAKTVVLYCAGGGRAALAGMTLKDMGYADVRNLGGFKDWVSAGLPVERA